ncbi:polysaccharide deacetylase family protein [Microbacteriaceae bacterium VKM Ac-2854]|nr:polysaccharide deacetylase family protein [Microbacteriaceae bacterium VKM Ac-2854]
MRRRDLLTLASAVPLTALAGCAAQATPDPTTATPTHTPRPTPATAQTAAPVPTPTPTAVAPQIEKIALPGPGQGLYDVGVDGDYLMWTVDDGGDAEVIRRYAEMARDSGTRLVFFPNAKYSGWAESADILRPLVESGQVQIGNHTYSHADLTSLTDQGIIDELTRNDNELSAIFGVSTKPYYRPPFGYRNDHTDAVAASIGFTTPVMWYGSLSDSGLITEQQVLDFADQWFLAGHLIIGHANFLPVTEVFPQLLQLLKDRGLQTVTLDDVYLR